MNKTYDLNQATRMVPLLDAILREIGDRSLTILELEMRLDEIGSDRSATYFDLHAKLANQRRALRYAKGELASLGCKLDTNQASRVLIPGSDGAEYEYTFGNDEVQVPMDSIS